VTSPAAIADAARVTLAAAARPAASVAKANWASAANAVAAPFPLIASARRIISWRFTDLSKQQHTHSQPFDLSTHIDMDTLGSSVPGVNSDLC
jgi:hypothetical protein